MRTASSQDVPSVRRVVAEAFVDDPLLRWAFPNDEHRLEMTAAWLGLFIEGYLATGARVDVIDRGGDVAAVAIWRMPDDPSPMLSGPPTIHGLLAALVGTERAEQVGDALAAFTGAWPEPPFAYLHFLAVAGPHRGRGFGRQVLAPGLEEADAAGLGVELETTLEANLGFYGSLGFRVTSEFTLASGGPRAWAMWRDPDG